jgi:alanine dehydrogenase
MKPGATLLLTRRDVAELLDLDECIGAVEGAFRRRGEGKVAPAGILGFPAEGGGFHIKAAGLDPYFAAKINGNFSRNRERFGLPAIQGIILLCDAGNGYPLAVLDSIEITIRRTGAATAVAAKYLAREDARVVTVCGCGNQGRVQLDALARVRRLERAYAFDTDSARSEEFASGMSRELGIPVEAVPQPGAAVRRSDIAVTCTPSRKPFLAPEDVRPGTFVAAVGADSEDKQELDPRILARGTVVVDSLDQCAEIGELHHALADGVMRRSDVHAELSDIAAGTRPGRSRSDEIIIFDSTGTALQDAAAAAIVYEKASRTGAGVSIDFAN